jgi:hypothetical protein
MNSFSSTSLAHFDDRGASANSNDVGCPNNDESSQDEVRNISRVGNSILSRILCDTLRLLHLNILIYFKICCLENKNHL